MSELEKSSERIDAITDVITESGAVIIAAGLSSRMHDFKPLLKIGDRTVIETVVNTMIDAGITNIVVVTGYKAELLEQQLRGYPVEIIRNPDYANTGMFESAILGIALLQKRCKRIIFTPADIPAFQVSTVKTLLEQECNLVCPVYHGKKGHPIRIAGTLIDYLLHDSGEGGLRGAFERSKTVMKFVPVEDEGILFDMDTKEDYCRMLTFLNSRNK